LQIAFEDAVFDQHGALGRVAFVIHIQGTATIRDRAIVDHGHAARGDLLTDHAGKSGGFLAVEVAFQTVTNGFVQQHAWPARTQHHGHFASRSRTRRQIQHRLIDRFFRVIGNHRIGEIAVIEPTAAAGATLLATTIFFNNDLDRQPAQRAHIGRTQTIVARDIDDFVFGRESGHHLHHALVERARGVFELVQHRDFGGFVQTGNRIVGQIELMTLTRSLEIGQTLPALAANRARGARRLLQSRQTDVVRIGKSGFLAADRAYTDALVDVEAARFNDAFIQTPRFAARVLKIQIGIVEIVIEHGAEHAIETGVIKAIGQQQVVAGKIKRLVHARLQALKNRTASVTESADYLGLAARKKAATLRLRLKLSQAEPCSFAAFSV